MRSFRRQFRLPLLISIAIATLLIAAGCNASQSPATVASPTVESTVPLETVAAGIGGALLPTSTPFRSTPTAKPVVSTVAPASTGTAELVLLAYSGQTAPGTDLATFTGFEPPIISSNGVSFTSVDHKTIVGISGFVGASFAGVWQYEPDELLDVSLDPIIVPGEMFANAYIGGQWIGAMSGDMNALAGANLAFRGRFRDRDGKFVDGIFYKFETGAVFDLAIEGPISSSAGNDLGPTLTQFDSFIYGELGIVYFRSPVSGDAIWRGHGIEVTSVLRERQGIEDLPPDWSVSAGHNIGMIGAGPDQVVLTVGNARWTQPNGSETKLDSGVWYFNTSNGVSERVMVAGQEITDAQAVLGSVQDVTFSGAASPFVGYTAKFESSAGGTTKETQTGVWKWDFQQVKTTLVAKSGDKIDIGSGPTETGRELADIGHSVIQSDGRMVFASSLWTESMDFIGVLMREKSDGELELLARTDQLPGSTWLETFGPQQVTEIATNQSGRVAFLLGIGEGLWVSDGPGRTQRVIEKGDQIEVNGETKTVEFIDFIGGSNTTSGRPSGLSDNGEIAFRTIFSDGTSAIYYTTFTGE